MEDSQGEDTLVGRRFGTGGSIVIEERLGEGGMGVVYRAWDERREHPLAVKFLLPERLGDRDILTRFKREGRRFARVRHPNLVRVHALGREQGLVFIATEFVPGRTVLEILREEGPFDVERGLAVCHAVASGLQAAHEHRIIHRDLKPENIMIRDDGVVKVLDFGIAKHLDASVALTRMGTYLGTPSYSAPEQIRGEEVDHRADIFGLGVLLYEFLTGRLAFDGRRTTDVLKATLKRRPVPPGTLNEQVVAPVARIIDRMIQKRPRKRFQSMGEVLEALEAVQGTLAQGWTREEKRGVRGLLKRLFEGSTRQDPGA